MGHSSVINSGKEVGADVSARDDGMMSEYDDTNDEATHIKDSITRKEVTTEEDEEFVMLYLP